MKINNDVLEQLIILDKKERLLAALVIWLKVKGLWEDAKKDLGLK